MLSYFQNTCFSKWPTFRIFGKAEADFSYGGLFKKTFWMLRFLTPLMPAPLGSFSSGSLSGDGEGASAVLFLRKRFPNGTPGFSGKTANRDSIRVKALGRGGMGASRSGRFEEGKS